ncbi:PucR family transcriptional regulator [[Clostridium] hylemonae]|uniref:PucR family transcriptional regulator n=1 Tax=[Clostridium] hylemonae TaxID=89153 RepID=UPI001FCB4741|nr:PucR family transcriptional regulator [[Clostridium] hylemonae]BDF06232.1 purine catabolism regulatory protein [[Clostridium] hylemonae]
MKSSLEWLVTASGLKNIKCIACDDLTNTRFDGVTVLDNPDAIRWVKQDELAVTTGYFLLHDEEAQKRIVRELKEAGCAGLGVKIRDYFQEIPEGMVKEAEKVKLPLLELPFYYSLSEVSQTIYNHIYELSYRSRVKEQKLIEDISDIFFSKRGTMEIVYRIAEFLKRTVILLDSDFKCVYAAKRMNDKKLCMKDSVIRRLKSLKNDECVFLFPDKTERKGYTVTIPGAGANALLLVLEDAGELTKEEKSIIERCIKILSMALEQARSRQEDRYEFEDSYHKDLYEYLNGLRQYDDGELKNILRDIEMPFEKKRIMILLQIQGGFDAGTDYRELIQGCIRKCKEMRGFEPYILSRGRKFIVYLFACTDKSDPFMCSAAGKLAGIMAERMGRINDGMEVQIGIGKSSDDFPGIKRAYQEAEKAVDIGEKLGMKEQVFAYNQLEFYDYLLQYPVKTKEQCCDSIRCLQEYDEENNTELVHTLLGFLEHKFNVSETAKALYIHRNTLINRLNKIKELLYNDLETMDDLMPLCMEAYAYKLFS